MRVATGRDDLYAYPGIVVVCGEPMFHDTHHDTLTNPVILVEVLSEAYDRGAKFEQYRGLEPLRKYVPVAQDRAHIEQYLRQDGDRRLLTEVSGTEGSPMPDAIGCELPVADIYDKVDLRSAPGRWPEAGHVQ